LRREAVAVCQNGCSPCLKRNHGNHFREKMDSMSSERGAQQTDKGRKTIGATRKGLAWTSPHQINSYERTPNSSQLKTQKNIFLMNKIKLIFTGNIMIILFISAIIIKVDQDNNQKPTPFTPPFSLSII
jgi:hypothetical protein